MKKFVLFIILFIFLIFPTHAQTLQGGISYTVESAREEAFKNIEYTIPMESYKQYLKDSGYVPPKKAGGKPHIKKFGRFVTLFSDGTYCVSKTNFALHYTKNGLLEYIEIIEGNYNYPKLGKKYDVNGKLIIVFLMISPNESYSYNADKKYRGHWIKSRFYNKQNELELIRY
jgi:hypothetical protein